MTIDLLPPLPLNLSLGYEPTMDEMMEALEGISNSKDVGSDGLPAELFILDHPAVAQCFHDILVNVRVTGEVPRQWTDAIIKVLHKKKDRTDRNNSCRGISRVTHEGKLFLKIVACYLTNSCGTEGILLEEPCGFRRARLTIDMLVAVRRLQEFGRLYMFLIDLQKAYD